MRRRKEEDRISDHTLISSTRLLNFTMERDVNALNSKTSTTPTLYMTSPHYGSVSQDMSEGITVTNVNIA